jgi:hypothetical protein
VQKHGSCEKDTLTGVEKIQFCDKTIDTPPPPSKHC